jgi:hypothetical protein
VDMRQIQQNRGHNIEIIFTLEHLHNCSIQTFLCVCEDNDSLSILSLSTPMNAIEHSQVEALIHQHLIVTYLLQTKSLFPST